MADHEGVLRQLSRGTPAARRLAAELGVQWEDPEAAYTLLMANLPEADNESLEALRQFLDAARGIEGPAAARVRGQLQAPARRAPGREGTPKRGASRPPAQDTGSPA